MKVVICLLLAFLAMFIQSLFIPLNIFSFSPFLAILFLNSSFNNALWISAFTGLIVDLFSSLNFGLHTASFTILTIFLYPYRKFFSETPLNIAIFSSLISLVCSLVEWPLLFIFGDGIRASLGWLLSDFILMPMIDGFYAFLWFGLPLSLLSREKRYVGR